jgi:hypothetical protein
VRSSAGEAASHVMAGESALSLEAVPARAPATWSESRVSSVASSVQLAVPKRMCVADSSPRQRTKCPKNLSHSRAPARQLGLPRTSRAAHRNTSPGDGHHDV